MKTKNKIIQYFLIIPTFFLIVFISASGQAATHYVSPSGSATWANSTNINTPSSLDMAKSNAKAGDTVYLRGGTYKSRFIISNSGSSDNPITFVRYQSEVPTLTNYSNNGYMNGKSYIVLDGLTFSGGTNRQVYITYGSNYVEIKNCTFGGNSGGPALSINISDYAYIHDNIFNAQAEATGEGTENDAIGLSGAKYSRIINNTITDGGGHAAIMVANGSTYNVIRGNTITLTSFWTTSNSALDTAIAANKNSSHNLIEDNIIYDQAGLTNTGRSEGLKNHASSYNIWRRNIVYDWDRYGWSCWNGDHSTNSNFNTIYNNTFYNINNNRSNSGSMAINAGKNSDAKYNQFVNNIVHTSKRHGLTLNPANSDRIMNNQIIGNIFYNISEHDALIFKLGMNIEEANTNQPDEFRDNISDTDNGGVGADPKFVDPENANFSLQQNSPAIDAGAWLTTITSTTGSGKTFSVDNQYFFYSGWGIPNEIGDTIKTENGQSATITSINYTTGTVTVNSSIRWTNGEGIALYYEGMGPDIGAKEYSSDNVSISSPKGLKILYQ